MFQQIEKGVTGLNFYHHFARLTCVRCFVPLGEPDIEIFEGSTMEHHVDIDHPQNQPETVYTILDILDQGKTASFVFRSNTTLSVVIL